MLQYLFGNDFSLVLRDIFIYMCVYAAITFVPNLIFIIGFSKVVKALKDIRRTLDRK